VFALVGFAVGATWAFSAAGVFAEELGVDTFDPRFNPPG
jgi:hypothetical protein